MLSFSAGFPKARPAPPVRTSMIYLTPPNDNVLVVVPPESDTEILISYVESALKFPDPIVVSTVPLFPVAEIVLEFTSSYDVSIVFFHSIFIEETV